MNGGEDTGDVKGGSVNGGEDTGDGGWGREGGREREKKEMMIFLTRCLVWLCMLAAQSLETHDQ